MSPQRPPRPGTTQVRVGRLLKAHGLKGAIKVELYTDDPDRRFTPGAEFALQVPTSSDWHGKKLELIELRWYNSHPVAFFKDVPDRTAAESLVKAVLWVDHDAAELPEEEDAWYDHQLVGLQVARDGAIVGTVARVEHFPAQDLLVVTTPDGEVMVPFVKAIVPEVDITTGIVTVTPPAGLFEELPESDDEAPEASAEAVVDQPAADETAAEEPSVDEPGADDEAGSPEPGSDEPGSDEPGSAERPGA